MNEANSFQVGGSHYATGEGGMQHWDYALDVLRNRYLEGCITKYLSRHRKKHGAVDLDKAGHYLAKLIEAAMEGRETCLQEIWRRNVAENIAKFCATYELTPAERTIVQIVSTWGTVKDLHTAQLYLTSLRQGVYGAS